MVWHYENTVTTKHAPEVVWDFMTDYTPNDHNTPAFQEENGGRPWPREVARLDGDKVRLKDTARRFWTEITVDLSERPYKLPTEGASSLGTWKGLTTLTRTPEGGTKWHSAIDIAPQRFAMKLLFALLGGSLRKNFQRHENKHFAEFEQEMAKKAA